MVWLAVTAALASVAPTAHPHDFKAGSVIIDHPYATPTPPGARTGAVYFRALRNGGRDGDRLVGARTDVASSVEIHRAVVDGNDVMRMRQLESLELPPGASPNVRHGGDVHLMLVDLKTALKDGERFRLSLRFERAGEREVTVWVQRPRDAAAGGHKH
ncbi:MAG: copper chaperone PCu(A)C [Burkholderiales bacterium]|nr:MAG: copper chaperone PCu(A)C [Burkholderiales bacterium]